MQPFSLLPLISAPLPADHSRLLIPDGVAGTAATIKQMQLLVTQGKRDFRFRGLIRQIIENCPEKAYECYGRAAYEWCRDQIRYVYDPAGVEMIEYPWRIVEAGIADCDSIVVLLATLVECMGFSARYVTIKANPETPSEYSHVFLEVLIPGKGWVGADATMKDKHWGWSPPARYERKVWNASNDAPEHVEASMYGLSGPSNRGLGCTSCRGSMSGGSDTGGGYQFTPSTQRKLKKIHDAFQFILRKRDIASSQGRGADYLRYNNILTKLNDFYAVVVGNAYSQNPPNQLGGLSGMDGMQGKRIANEHNRLIEYISKHWTPDDWCRTTIVDKHLRRLLTRTNALYAKLNSMRYQGPVAGLTCLDTAPNPSDGTAPTPSEGGDYIDTGVTDTTTLMSGLADATDITTLPGSHALYGMADVDTSNLPTSPLATFLKVSMVVAVLGLAAHFAFPEKGCKR